MEAKGIFKGPYNVVAADITDYAYSHLGAQYSWLVLCNFLAVICVVPGYSKRSD